ncbi:MAG: GNAT family N-acetyltransferase [bacterium]
MALHIETDRLILRSLEAGDAEPLARIWTDPDVTRHMGGPRIFDEARSNILSDARQPTPPKYDLWPVVEKATGHIVGHCGLLDKEVDGRLEIELVYVLAKDVWGKGYATEAAIALREYAFKDLGLLRLIALIEPENTASARVAEKVGFTFERATVRSGGAVRHVYALQAPSRPGTKQ